ncbi:MAG: TetR/AcrR family transcriptional regulator [Nitrospirae bacterium]|nr:TetR/AcrR family transcriptional regulator [Nitrospirota bacterium]
MISKRNYRESKTRERIMEVAEALFADKGYYGASLGNMAKKVGIAKASLLHHFPSKKALYEAILTRGFGELARVLGATLEGEGDGFEKLSSMLAGYSRWLRANPHRCRLLMREQLDNPRQSREGARKYVAPMVAKVEAFVDEAQRRGEFSGVDARLLLFQVAGSMTHFALVLPSISFLMDDGGRRSNDEIWSNFQSHVFEMARRALTAPSQVHEGGSHA